MKILGIDTATESCSAALYVDGRIVSRQMEFERGHAEHILPMVDEVLAAGGVAPEALDALAFGRGPGGFTGVRLAASVVQGLAFAWNRVVVPVSDLAAVAQRALHLDPGTTRVLVCNDARMQEVYWACFQRGPQGLAVLVGEEHVSPPTQVRLPVVWGHGTSVLAPNAQTGSPSGLNKASVGEPAGGLADIPVGSVAGVGRGFRAYPNLVVCVGPQVQVLDDALLPRAEEIVRLAVAELQAGRAVAADQAIPVYLRDDIARPQSRN